MDPTKELRAAWDDLIHELQLARDALEDPAYFPPPPSDRNLAEGYRYLLGQLHRLIETETHQSPDFPYFQRHPWTISKYTIDNPDCLYLFAPIRPDAAYRVTGRAANTAHWSGERASGGERFAPTYVIFETQTVAPGDSGTVAELTDGSRVTVGKLDSPELKLAPDGSFEILIAPERPAGHTGNYIPSATAAGTSLQRGDVARTDVFAHKLYVRELFGDWEGEDALELCIEREGFAGRGPAPRLAAQTADQMRQLGRLVRNHIRYWNSMYGVVLDPFGRAAERRPNHLAKNGLAQPKPASTAGGGGQSTNFYAGGVFDLAPDEALLVEARVPVRPEYSGFHLANYWGEALDYANFVTSVNHQQAYRSGDGAYRYVVSHADPGVQNWLDTTGHPSGYMTMRFTYTRALAPVDHPVVATLLMKRAEVRARLPTDTPAYSPAERRSQVVTRQAHVARRYRQY
jgi:hypothetical protein